VSPVVWRRVLSAAFLLGLACFLTGGVVAFTASWSTGRILISLGGLVMGLSGLIAWRLRLPAA
jgi:hypothetical protein